VLVLFDGWNSLFRDHGAVAHRHGGQDAAAVRDRYAAALPGGAALVCPRAHRSSARGWPTT
jgi:hypothetical protein